MQRKPYINKLILVFAIAVIIYAIIAFYFAIFVSDAGAQTGMVYSHRGAVCMSPSGCLVLGPDSLVYRLYQNAAVDTRRYGYITGEFLYIEVYD